MFSLQIILYHYMTCENNRYPELCSKNSELFNKKMLGNTDFRTYD